MLEKFTKSLSKDSNELINKGFIKFKIEDTNYLESIKNKFIKFLFRDYQIKINNLSELHKHLDYNKVNKLRLAFYNEINHDTDFSINYLDLGINKITDIVGTELAGNKKVNLSIQMPEDESSSLPIHCDTFSGESEFQINLWVPLTNCYDTNSMFIFNPDFSLKINQNLIKYEESGLDLLLEDNKEEYEFLNCKYGEGIIFTPTCLHGNITNSTESTRISFNCRYKNIFSPYADKEENEKKLGSFYKLISPKAATIIGLKNKINY
jgi:sporadic carbohydrate cluster 2OG-Fe(II) oxygenase